MCLPDGLLFLKHCTSLFSADLCWLSSPSASLSTCCLRKNAWFTSWAWCNTPPCFRRMMKPWRALLRCLRCCRLLSGSQAHTHTICAMTYMGRMTGLVMNDSWLTHTRTQTPHTHTHRSPQAVQDHVWDVNAKMIWLCLICCCFLAFERKKGRNKKRNGQMSNF